jgi:hypothetical protein
MMEWIAFEDGKTIGTTGSEGGVIRRDEECPNGARITLEEGTLMQVPFAITCGVYGWLVHTRFIADQPTAENAYDNMKLGLEDILTLLERDDPDMLDIAIQDFMERYP